MVPTFQPCVDSAHMFTQAGHLACGTLTISRQANEMQFDNTQNISALKMYFQTFLQ